ncbi:MAG: CBS domain-containing protein [Kiloniellales bacterium]
MTRDDFDIRRALQDPRAVFGTPERVLSHPRLDRDRKRAILERWEQDERELAVAEEEGMGGGERSLLQQVHSAQRELAGRTAEGAGPTTKHGGGTGSKPGNQTPPLIRDLMHVIDEVVHVDQDLHEAYVRMQQSNVPFLPVADGDEIVGILTARDIYGERRLADDGKKAARVGDHLSKEIAFCHVDDDVATARAVMDHSGHHRLLVVDDEEQLVGLISLEMIAATLRQRSPGRPRSAMPEAAERVVETSGRAKGDSPGRPWLYAVKPKLKP